MATKSDKVMSAVDVGRKRRGLLITPDLCIGCRGCQAACKQWNRLAGEKTVNTGSYENPPDLTPNLYNQIHFIEKNMDVGVQWLFVRRSCKHCGKAGCMDICPAPGALFRTAQGAVGFSKSKCIGCKLCLAACPFDVPRFDSDGKISKCHLCSNRIANGLEPACAKTCTTGAIKFGDRGGLVASAEAAGYKVYGKTELNGLGVTFALKQDRTAYELPVPAYSAGITLWDSIIRPLTVIGFGVAVAGAVVHYTTVGPNEIEPEDKEGGEG